MRVESIADHLHLVDQIARWHWDEWGQVDPNGSLESWTAGLRLRTSRNAVPTTFVALDDGGRLLGSVTLVEHDMRGHRGVEHLTPWIAGTFVAAAARGRGVGTALMRHAVAEAGRWRIPRLYLYTSAAEAFYERLGWAKLSEAEYENEQVVIMSLELDVSPR